MGRLQLHVFSAILLCGSVVLAGYSTNKEDLERTAELAVERAAEKAAERAVEKALNSGNSSTVTVTVKESYSNAKKTAEEAAAPGSESTRPYDPNIYNRQYSYSPPVDGSYKVDEDEAKELGLSKESVNSSVENLGSAEAAVEPSAESVEAPTDLSFESVKGSDKSVPASFDTSTGLGFGADFSGLDISSSATDFKGDFGLKSSTKTFSSSYSKAKDDFPTTKVDVDDEEDAEIFKMYASDFGDAGWSSTKQDGWVRHRPLWDDSKARVSRGFWDEFEDISAVETKATNTTEKVPVGKEKIKLHKRMAERLGDKPDQIAVPLATLSLDPKTPAALYQLLQKREKSVVPFMQMKGPMPMKVYITIPMPYLSSNDFGKNYGSQAINEQDSKSFVVPPPDQLNDEINEEGSLISREPFKRSPNIEKGNFFSSDNGNVRNPARRERSYRSVIRVPRKIFNAKYSNPKNLQKNKN